MSQYLSRGVAMETRSRAEFLQSHACELAEQRDLGQRPPIGVCISRYRPNHGEACTVKRMLIVELAFTATSERLVARPAHRTVLLRLHAEGRLVAAGPWADDMGAVLIFNVDREALNRILDADPYYRAAGVEIIRIREWTPVVRPADWPD
jgi:uncharacterized protein YciI